MGGAREVLRVELKLDREGDRAEEENRGVDGARGVGELVRRLRSGTLPDVDRVTLRQRRVGGEWVLPALTLERNSEGPVVKLAVNAGATSEWWRVSGEPWGRKPHRGADLVVDEIAKVIEGADIQGDRGIQHTLARRQ